MTALYGPGKIRRGTSAAFISGDPTLADGELAMTLDGSIYNTGIKFGRNGYTWTQIGFGPDVFGHVKRGGYLYGRADYAATALGRADGKTRIVPSGFGSVAGGHAYNSSTTNGAVRIVATAPGSFAHGRATQYSATTSVGYSELGARGLGAHVFGYAYAVANGKVAIQATEFGAMAVGYAMGNSSTLAKILASGRGSFAGGVAYGDANNIVASGRSAFQWGPGTNAVNYSLAVGVALRLNGPVGTPGALRNGDIWVASNYVYIRTNGVSKKIV